MAVRSLRTVEYYSRRALCSFVMPTWATCTHRNQKENESRERTRPDCAFALSHYKAHWLEWRCDVRKAESADAERRVYVGGPESAVNTMYNVHSDSDRIPRCWTASLTTASVARSLSAHIDATLCYCPFSLCHGSLADGGKSPMLKLLAVERINTVVGVGYGIWVIVAVESTRSFI